MMVTHPRSQWLTKDVSQSAVYHHSSHPQPDPERKTHFSWIAELRSTTENVDADQVRERNPRQGGDVDNRVHRDF